MTLPHLNFDLVPPSDWEQRCAAVGSLFHSPAWQNVLRRGFNCQPLYIWADDDDSALTLSVFPKGPFRIGYLGFPAGGTMNGTLRPSLVRGLRNLALPVDMVRIPLSGFAASGGDFDLPAVTTPETAIIDLQAWRLESVPKFRRNVQKGRNARIQPRVLQDPGKASAIFELYRNTVVRHAGNVRYTADYFYALAELSLHCPDLNCWVMDMEGETIGFLVAAMEGDTAYYLHGGINDRLRQLSGSAMLFDVALRWAQEKGARRFNFMSSPPTQPSLVRYKEKMGGVTRCQSTYELPLRPVRAAVLRAASRIYHKCQRLRLIST